jgi:fermentation-respiration switch protein FrsA (DUF1100 family)
MTDSVLDRPEVLRVLFHPRRETGAPPPQAEDLLIPVADGERVGARLHLRQPAAPTLLFFHGNGEIVADYDDLGPLYNRLGLNFLPVDYRGYGRSSGRPSVAGMLRDCHAVLAFVEQRMAAGDLRGPLILMGRSLGSASVLELAAAAPGRIDGLIVESGFAYAAPLLRLLGVDPQAIGFDDARGFGNLAKIAAYPGPTLIIHAEFDHIIPFSDGKALFEASPDEDKRLLKVAGADHNDILLRGGDAYLAAVRDLAQRCRHRSA